MPRGRPPGKAVEKRAASQETCREHRFGLWGGVSQGAARSGVRRGLRLPIPRRLVGGSRKMSALGKHVLDGDFDEKGQIVQSPAERVLERSVVVTRTVTEAPAKPAPKSVAASQSELK